MRLPTRRLAVAATAALLAVPAQAGAASHLLDATCTFNTTGIPNTSDVVVQVVANAASDGVSTGVRCVVFNAHGTVEAPWVVLPGPASASAAVKVVPQGSFTICVEALAVYADATVRSFSRCISPL